MKKNKFIKSTIILIVGGFITKLLGMIIKVTMTRLLGTEGIGIYMMIIPTFSLLIALAQLGLPVAISKLVAEDKKNNKNLVLSSIPITLIINVIIIFVLLFSAKYIANNLLHDKRCYYALISIGFVLPFISISSILRGYFFGKQKMFPHVLSNITEDIIRLIILAIGIPIFLIDGIEYAIAFVVLSNIISELTSIFIFFFFLPKKFKITKEDIKINNNNVS
ncbi:MAG: oligosaccharide flippase family protein, partial [Bacilli bacterium]|nr:oligosaccharide flippase family protein [Bacilli bacterium]